MTTALADGSKQAAENVGNYCITDMTSRALAALDVHRDYMDEMLARYAERKAWRVANRVPTVAVLGMGRAGKDTAAEYICHRVPGMVYAGSSSNRLCRFVAHMVGLSEEQAFAERHDHRDFWIAAGHAIRGQDLTLLARITLGWGDLAVGLRGRQELHGCVRDGVIDYSLWIDNPRVPVDKTVEFTAGDCDCMIPNWGSYLELYRKLDRWLKLVHDGAFPSLK